MRPTVTVPWTAKTRERRRPGSSVPWCLAEEQPLPPLVSSKGGKGGGGGGGGGG